MILDNALDARLILAKYVQPIMPQHALSALKDFIWTMEFAKDAKKDAPSARIMIFVLSVSLDLPFQSKMIQLLGELA